MTKTQSDNLEALARMAQDKHLSPEQRAELLDYGQELYEQYRAA
jgi:hypothetical protein